MPHYAKCYESHQVLGILRISRWWMFFSHQRTDLKQAIARLYLLIWSVCSDSQLLAPWH